MAAVLRFIRNPKDFYAGMIYLAIGLYAIVMGRELPMGTALAMGPAYFPTVLGAILSFIGLISLIRSLVRTGEPIQTKASKKARITPLTGFKEAVMTPSHAPTLNKGVFPAA